ncbi:hypothetical protein DVVG_00044 [Dunaliella viridis virus SI2]|uniref:hypothetical protein n=1 Tax=Dunaliella viridis virus SI2 TaxID=754069 RepID=UPI0002C09A3F|nr:hypothetical protein DVVG_00044 [Dunaliella viridis virus SI2]AGH16030.1 hypothetical protein DVVG_00044 [Dunaliella viridis virus SI2]
MTDRNLDPELDLSVDTIRKLCKGRVENLPRFMVHDENWRGPVARIGKRADGTMEIHMQRAAFFRIVQPQIPIKPGLWRRLGVQEYLIDLQAHHLGGSGDTMGPPTLDRRAVALQMTKSDAAGRQPDEVDYGAEALERAHVRQVSRADIERARREGQGRSVGSSVFADLRDTECDVAVGDND